MSLGKIKTIKEVCNLKLGRATGLNGSNGSSAGFAQMLSLLRGYGEFDGYKIETDSETYVILIENGQSCCESWGI